MRLHRFFVGDIHSEGKVLELSENFWLKDETLCRQLTKVMRYRAGSRLILFDGRGTEGIFEIKSMDAFGIAMSQISAITPTVPKRNTYLLWALLKKDKNDWVLQKCTELGVTHFMPIITERTEKTGFDVVRAHKIVVEAAEQCGRHDIPDVYEAISCKESLIKLASTKLYVADVPSENQQAAEISISNDVGIIIGPEGGFTDQEREFLRQQSIEVVSLGQFVLRAETACIVAAQKIAG